MAKEDLKVPFDKDGNVCFYPHPHYIEEWKDNYTFHATLEFVEFERGRSAAHAIWQDVETKRKYPMFLTSLGKVMRHMIVEGGRITGDFTFNKRGSNYALDVVVV